MAKINFVPIYSMIRKDLSQLLHNRSMMTTIVITLLFNLIIPQIITFQVRDINIAVVSHDRSELSDNIIRDIAYTGDFVINGQCATYDDAMVLVKDGKVDCIVEIPAHFERDFIASCLSHTTTPRIQLSANAINTTKVLSATQNIVGAISLTLRNYARDHGVTATYSGTYITTENLYNPSFDYKLLMLPVIFITMTLIFSISTRMITNEIQYGTIDQINVSPMSRWAFMTGKITASYIVSMVCILTSMASLWLTYDFSPHGDIMLVLLALSLYVICCSCIALILCNLSSTISQMLLFSSVFSLVAMMMSGYITPLQCIADWLQPVSYIMPPRYIIVILRNVTLKGADFQDLYSEFLHLSLLTVVLYILSVLTFKKSRE